MVSSEKPKTRLRVGHLPPRQPTTFAVEPDAAARAALAQGLDLIDLTGLRFSGKISPAASESWLLEGDLHAVVTQPCVISAAPVTTRIDEPVRRLYSPHVQSPEGEEVEMPDEDIEPLGQYIDLDEILAETLALGLPLYPRAPDAALPDADSTTQDDLNTRRPFAGLADLMKKGD